MVKHAQISIEFILVFGFALLLLIPTVYLFYQQGLDSTVEIESQQLVGVGNAIVADVEQIFLFGPDSFKTLQFRLSSRIENITLLTDNSTELIITKMVRGEPHNLVFFSRYPMRIGSCTGVEQFSTDFLHNPGPKSLRIRSCGTYVSIKEIKE